MSHGEEQIPCLPNLYSPDKTYALMVAGEDGRDYKLIQECSIDKDTIPCFI
jgi:hypothetical protein